MFLRQLVLLSERLKFLQPIRRVIRGRSRRSKKYLSLEAGGRLEDPARAAALQQNLRIPVDLRSGIHESQRLPRDADKEDRGRILLPHVPHVVVRIQMTSRVLVNCRRLQRLSFTLFHNAVANARIQFAAMVHDRERLELAALLEKTYQRSGLCGISG